MAPTTNAPKQLKKRKLGKGKKKAWRAAKVEDLEEFIDDERRQRETGGLVSEKSNEKLFFVDKVKTPKVKSSGTRVSKEERRNRPLRVHALLKPSDNIKSVIVPLKENYKKGKRTQKILDSIKERAASQVRVAAAEQSQKYAFKRKAARIMKSALPDVNSDIWNDNEMDTAKVKRPQRLLMKPSKIDATIIPHPGASVNPTYEDHQDLLKIATDIEEKKEKSSKAAANALKVSNRKDIATKETYLVEMSAGLIDDSESENDEKEQDDSEITPSVRVPQRKTKRQRKAEAKVKEQLTNKKLQADKNRRESMVFRLKSMKSEIRKRDERTKAKLQTKLKKREEAPFKTKRLGKAKFEEPPIQLKLPEELVKSLREVKPEGHILNDVYKNMMRRNILETCAKQRLTRKNKRKLYIKRSHKEIMNYHDG